MAKPKKKKSKLKRILGALGKVAKVAAIGGAGYLGARAFGGRRKGNVLKTAAMENANVGSNVRPFVDDYKYTPRVPDHPSNIQSIEGGGSAPMTWRRNINKIFNTSLKKGGRVTGIAKRGFGRALKKK